MGLGESYRRVGRKTEGPEEERDCTVRSTESTNHDPCKLPESVNHQPKIEHRLDLGPLYIRST